MRNTIIVALLLISSSAVAPAGAAADEASPTAGATSVDNASDARPRTLYLVATAHLDTQWRWTIEETIDDFIPKTFRVNAKHFEDFKDYVFSFEGAFRYMLLREYYPEYYERLKTYVADGRWHVAGSWLDAVDVNVPSPESLVRHTLYGNGYFQREFGKTSRDVYLPDCFGFGYALPSIAAHSGLEFFSTQKLTWGSWVGVPFDIGVWQGVDGSTLTAALNPGAYVSRVRGDLSRDSVWVETIERQGETSGLYAGFKYYGTGDTGGGPDSLSVAWVEKSLHSDGPLDVRLVGTDALADAITPEQREKLPRYNGELLMTRHGVGCYTSQAAMKRWNRKNECLADAAERASVIAWLLGGAPYPREQLRTAWVRFLWHQFHDDLTGTSIPEAYVFSWNDEILSLNQFASTLESAVSAAARALDTRADGVPLVVFNPLSIAREDIVEATVVFGDDPPEAVRVYGPEGVERLSQVVGKTDDGLRIVFLASVPPVGYAVYDVRPSHKPCGLKTRLRVDESTIENDWYRVRVDSNGDVVSITDKALERELLSAPIQLQMLYDRPDAWAAWEIDYDEAIAEPQAVVGGPAEVRIVENGPARVALEIAREAGSSTFRQTIRLAAGGAGGRVEVDNVVDWYERETLLKAAFALTPADTHVTYDLGLGTIARGINKPELYEVPGQQWADLTSGRNGFGVAVLNDCKYGWDHPDPGTLRLTLIHTPGVPESWRWIDDQRSQDIGRHEFTYAIKGHCGDWRTGSVQWEAARLNQPLLAFQTKEHKGTLGKTYSFLTVDAPDVAVRAVKLAEDSDEIVVRLQELHGTPSNVRVEFDRRIARAREVNGAEEPTGDNAAVVVDGVLEVSMAPYRPRAFALTFEAGDDIPLDRPSARPLELPFNLDGVSLDLERRDGDFDGRGNTLSGDLLPDTLVWNGIPFVFGSTLPGASNAVSCTGQRVKLPAGGHDRLYLLATATGGPARGSFAVGGSSSEMWIQDYAEPIAQWNSRLITGEFKDDNASIAPGYINRAPVAWAGTHRHSAGGENEAYQFTYLYLVELPLPSRARSLTLPQNERIKVMAATLVDTGADVTRAAQPLYDVADATVTEIHADRYTFLNDIDFVINSPIPGAEIHYTLDGSDPTRQSTRYTGPVTLTETSVVKSRAFTAGADNSFTTAVAFERLVPVLPIGVGDVSPGLHCDYYEGEWSKLPDFETLTPAAQFVASTATIPDIAREEHFGLVFTGYVRIPRDGLYDFSIASDDGSKLYLAGRLVADNDGLHGTLEVTGALALKPGFYPLTALMFQRRGGRALEVSIEGAGLEKQSIPATMLFHNAD
jgi:alpha-mannosidase